MRHFLLCFLFVCLTISAQSRNNTRFADSIRVAYNVPELAYAVISTDSIIEMHVSGVTKINTAHAAGITDRFRIGSNTKTITAFIAAELVKQGKIKWTTKFFDLYPELKNVSKKEYYNTTLLELLSFRSSLMSWTYTNDAPTLINLADNEEQQRYQFIQWSLQKPPIKRDKGFGFSNPGYVAAGLMLERASGKSCKQLITELGKKLDIDFGFGAPNMLDTLQPWGHYANLEPEAPADNYKLNWLLPAGNVNVTLPDYAKFIQLQLKGLRGQSTLLSKKEFEYLHFGLPEFAVGWFWREENGHKLSFHTGNPGTFLSQVFIDRDNNRAYILFANAQTDKTSEVFEILLSRLTGS